MIRHIVLFRWSPDAAAGEIEAAIERLSRFGMSNPGCIDFRVADNIGGSPANFDCAVIADFSSRSAYESYANDPAHRDLIRRNDPVVLDKAAIQIEAPPLT